MKFFIVGLGSMGKRRVRCLKALGYQDKDIAGFDVREDRRNEAGQQYGITTYSSIDHALETEKPSALIISVPPDLHHIYMKIAIDRGISFFVEASVVDTDMLAIKEKLRNMEIVAAPSATLLFHPAIRIITDVVKNGDLGKISNILFHSGQYLPDWHTYEKVEEYYVSNPSTGGAREIAPFELTWLTHVFGFPRKVCGNVRKTIAIHGAERIDDTYNFLLDYDDMLASITIDVVSRFATRRLVIKGDQKQLIWDWNLQNVQIYEPSVNQWEKIQYDMKSAASGYNLNIGENMYIDELHAFIQAIEEKKPFINSIKNDHRVLKLLYAVEQSDRDATYIKFEA